ncbi:hypothetical protein JNE31_09020 [Streptococcus suis]|uniref:hypothetical protein n=1 Tax=Streptococcus suis TaxID=1307 RepID=UPI00192E1EC2|nr:hypothetical protein [Streptococcus suis]MBL6504501.1 hypothetical protein [Streptococcus suis]
MKKKEWIRYFEAINNRKPTKEEIYSAITEEEFEPTFFDNCSKFIRKIIQSRIIRILILASIIFLVVAITSFPLLKRGYHLFRSENYDKQYKKVIDKYQEALDNNDKGKEFEVILEQPTRKPSYAQIDSNNDGKDELYIAFIDEDDDFDIIAVDVIAVYEVQSGKIKQSDVKISDEELTDAYWESFDVEHLITMNLEELSSNYFYSIEGQWGTEDGSQKITFDNEGLAYINSFNARQEKSVTIEDLMIYGFDTTLSGGFIFREISKGRLYGTLTYRDGSDTLHGFYFLPKGIEYGNTNKSYDRIYDDRYKVTYYRFSDMVASVENLTSETSKIDFVELSNRNYSSISGKWASKSATDGEYLEIDENGLVYLPWSESLGLQIVDLKKIGSGWLSGYLSLQEGVTGQMITIMPAGVENSDAKNSDSSKDRIAIGDRIERFNDPQVYYRVE